MGDRALPSSFRPHYKGAVFFLLPALYVYMRKYYALIMRDAASARIG